MNAYNVEIDHLFDKSLNYVLSLAGIKLSEISIKTRKREILEYQQAIIAFAHWQYEYTNASAAALFGKNHATTDHTCKEMRKDQDNARKFPKMITKRLMIYNKLCNIKNNRI